MQSGYIVTFIGDDRPGLVEALSAAIGNNGGNWQESRLSQLGGKFAGLILVTLPDDKGEALEADLRALAATGLSVRVTSCDAQAASAAGRTIELTVVGPDRPGIVKEISHALAERQFNVLEMESGVSSAPMSAEPLFQAHIVASIAEDAQVESLHASLDEIANSMTLDIDVDW